MREVESRVARAHAVRAMSRYWPVSVASIESLPMPVLRLHIAATPPQLQWISLPEWAADLGVRGGSLAVPRSACAAGEEPSWQCTDWLSAAFWFMQGMAERAHEEAYGPIHSYSVRLRGWDSAMWEFAWVNRIALFLRRWAARESGNDEAILFGVLPAAEIQFTHDIEEVRPTWRGRSKRLVMDAQAAVREVARGRLHRAVTRAGQTFRSFAGDARADHLTTITALVESCGMRGTIYVYARSASSPALPVSWIVDPAYSLTERGLAERLRTLHSSGWSIGLHQSHGAWESSTRMRNERETLERVLLAPVTACRQHWLRFDWTETWAAQAAAGLRRDATLGFNDRPAFRNGAALAFAPVDFSTGNAIDIEIVPLVLMDSHCYDYQLLDALERESLIRRWIDEIKQVRGVATILWHPHTLGSAFGWESGLHTALAAAAH